MRVHRNGNGTLNYIEDDYAIPAGEDAAASNPESMESMSIWEKVIKAPSGVGDVEDYIRHPLNFNGSSALAKIIRGMTGILGNLDLAIVDIVMGIIQLLLDRHKQEV